jgi:hypothetical protein
MKMDLSKHYIILKKFLKSTKFFRSGRSDGEVLAKNSGAKRSGGAVPFINFGAKRWSGNFI